jgi:hypothetical protein
MRRRVGWYQDKLSWQALFLVEHFFWRTKGKCGVTLARRSFGKGSPRVSLITLSKLFLT